MADRTKKTGGLSYADAGVDIAAGNALVKAIAPLAKATARPGSNTDLGGFAGLFDPKAAGYKDPLLLAATDGVGTKLRLAIDCNMHDTVGIDLVAMCVNDLIVQGAEPLFFLDYFASGKLDLGVAERVIAGIAQGCRQAGCALIGGETAEMPGMYPAGDYDLAGFAVGAMERSFSQRDVTLSPGDVLIGIASSGVHSNGFSLVRKILECQNLGFHDASPFTNGTIGEALLTPTRIYTQSCLTGLRDGTVKAMAHITGGGLLENIPRVLPAGLRAYVEANKWAVPPVFQWLAEGGELSPFELLRTFNCGVGMVLVCDKNNADQVLAHAQTQGDSAFVIGEIIEKDGEADVLVKGTDCWGYDGDWQAVTA